MPLFSKRIGIIQALADHDPDIDALYRLTQVNILVKCWDVFVFS